MRDDEQYYTISLNVSELPDIATCRRMDEDARVVFGNVAESPWMVAMMVGEFVLALPHWAARRSNDSAESVDRQVHARARVHRSAARRKSWARAPPLLSSLSSLGYGGEGGRE